jgi:putative endonuclease
MSNRHNTTLYTGVTNNLYYRVQQHKCGSGGVFTRKYNLVKLVYFEVTEDVSAAILREKQIKAGSRKKKIELIESVNPKWQDLFDEI